METLANQATMHHCDNIIDLIVVALVDRWRTVNCPPPPHTHTHTHTEREGGERENNYPLPQNKTKTYLCARCLFSFYWNLKNTRISEVRIGDGATTISPLHTSWLQPHLECRCPGGSAPLRKPAVQENVRQGVHDVQNHERSCRRKPRCWSAGVQKPQLQEA